MPAGGAVTVATLAWRLLPILLCILIVEGTLARILAEASQFDMLMGWLALSVFIPLAATSTDHAVRKMGLCWKPLQR